ncbi:MCE family protein [Gordonia sp. PDNC005]|uniref:MlaD family protein n=1 Tax=unclassified Gordonia (in: high G+C Gram-positive bacteria) TaxID=2657482 RepID=UPI0019629997|nr:MlaD family protein [Gordonia sp. PDNC005]QRY63197.1 MCE family protein [Gordonia sp. PDNC005]
MRALRRIASITLVAAVLSTVGCAAVTGGADRSTTYRIAIEFSNVLNIPSGARVLVDGVRSGMLADVTLRGDRAIADVDIDRDVRLTTNTRAELRQETLLGDLYIALSTRRGSATDATLVDGGRIPLSQTSPPDNVETVMLSVSQFLNGGLIGRIQTSLAEVNAALPSDKGELSALTKNAARQLIELAHNADRLDRVIVRGSSIVRTLADNRETIERAFTVGPRRFGKMQDMFLSLVGLISDLRILTKPGTALLAEPTYSDVKAMLSTVDPWLMEIANSDRSLGVNAVAVRDLITRRIVPFLSGGGEIDFTRTTDLQGRASALTDVLRGIGVV